MAQLQCIKMRAQLVTGVVHHIDALTQHAANHAQRLRLALDVTVVPAMNLETGKTMLSGGYRLLAKGQRRVQPIWVLLPVMGRGIHR